MIQIYPFHRTDVQEVYAQLNRFLEELMSMGIVVDLDHVRANTKYYPDYERTATTIEVCIDFSGWHSEVASQVRDLHQSVLDEQVDVPVADPENVVAEAYRLVRENGTRFILDRNSEGYFLTDTSDQGAVFWGVYRSDVLARVQQALGIQPAVTVPADEYDPFLDPDDLP